MFFFKFDQLLVLIDCRLRTGNEKAMYNVINDLLTLSVWLLQGNLRLMP